MLSVILPPQVDKEEGKLTRHGGLLPRFVMEGGARVEQERLTMSVDEAALALNINRQLAYKGVHDGTIPAIRIGKRILVSCCALTKLLEQGQPVIPQGQPVIPVQYKEVGNGNEK